MTQPYTDTELVRLAYREFRTHVYTDRYACTCGFKPGASVDWDTHVLAAVLSALAAAGRLTPADDAEREPVTYGGLVVHPGDTLIVWTDRPVTVRDANEYRTRLRERLPGLADVVVLNAAGVAAYRPTEEDTAPAARGLGINPETETPQ